MNILDKIVLNKRKEVEAAKRRVSYTKLEESDLFQRETYSFREFLLHPERTGIARIAPGGGRRGRDRILRKSVNVPLGACARHGFGFRSSLWGRLVFS